MFSSRLGNTSRGFILFSIFLYGTVGSFAAESCSIQNGPSPLLAKYIQDTSELMNQIKSQGKNICGTKPTSPTTAIRRVNQILDQSKLDFPSFDTIGTDFEIQILSVMRGESNSVALRDAVIFRKIEDATISPTIRSLAQNCSLDETTVSLIENRIKLNTALETIYKKTVAGEVPSNFIGEYTLPDEYLDLYQEIINNYHPSQTTSCKNTAGNEAMQEKISKSMENIMNLVQGKGVGIENALKDWKIALQLFQGGKGMKDSEYNSRQRKLLVAELARQGLSYNAVQSMVGRFDCMKQADQGEQDINQRMMNRVNCFQSDKMLLLKILKKNPPPPAKTSDEYVERLTKIDEKIIELTDMARLYNEVKSSLANSTQTTEETVTNLAQIHINLSVINLAIEKRIPMMQRNCMRQLPGIVGGCQSPN